MVMCPAQLQDVHRAHLHALPTRLAIPAVKADVLRFEPVLKREYFHNLILPKVYRSIVNWV
jgi:hypothetical protein